MKDKVTYLMVRVSTDKDIEQIVGVLETVELKISPLTRIDVIDTVTLTEDEGEDRGNPVIYFP